MSGCPPSGSLTCVQIGGRGSRNSAAQFLIDDDGWGRRVLAVSVRRWPIVHSVPPPRHLNHTSSRPARPSILTREPARSAGGGPSQAGPPRPALRESAFLSVWPERLVTPGRSEERRVGTAARG